MFCLQSTRARVSALLAATLVPVALVAAPHSTAAPGPDHEVTPVADALGPCCAENLPEAPPPAELPPHADLPAALPPESRVLGPGVGSEQGLQVKTVLAKRSVNALFPMINTIIGVRPDAKPWHPSGRAIDVMIPNHSSPEGIALGDSIRDFALRNAAQLGVQDVIWRGTYYTPAGPGGSGYGHFDHVHITTVGGGYADGGAEYVLVGT